MWHEFWVLHWPLPRERFVHVCSNRDGVAKCPTYEFVFTESVLNRWQHTVNSAFSLAWTHRCMFFWKVPRSDLCYVFERLSKPAVNTPMNKYLTDVLILRVQGRWWCDRSFPVVPNGGWLTLHIFTQQVLAGSSNHEYTVATLQNGRAVPCPHDQTKQLAVHLHGTYVFVSLPLPGQCTSTHIFCRVKGDFAVPLIMWERNPLYLVYEGQFRPCTQVARYLWKQMFPSSALEENSIHNAQKELRRTIKSTSNKWTANQRSENWWWTVVRHNAKTLFSEISGLARVFKSSWF